MGLGDLGVGQRGVQRRQAEVRRALEDVQAGGLARDRRNELHRRRTGADDAHAFAGQRAQVQARREQAERGLELTQKELNATKPMVATGAVSEVEILRLERDAARLRGDREQATAQISRVQAAIMEAQRRIEEVQLTRRNQFSAELSETLSRLSALREGGAALDDKVKYADIKSPVRGTVKLTGGADSLEAKLAAGKIAGEAEGVILVDNQLVVAGEGTELRLAGSLSPKAQVATQDAAIKPRRRGGGQAWFRPRSVPGRVRPGWSGRPGSRRRSRP